MRDRPAGGPVRAGLLLGAVLLALGAVGAAGFTGSGSFLREGASVPVLAAAWLVLLVAKPVLDAIACKADRGRRMLTVALALWICAVGLGYVAAELLDHPLVHRSHCSLWLCSTSSGGERERWTWAYMAAVTLALSVAAMIAARVVAAAIASPLLRPLCLWLAYPLTVAVLLLGSALILASTATRAQRPNPSLAAYVASLPELGRLPPPWSSMGFTGAPWRRPTDEKAQGCATARAGDVDVWLCLGSVALLRPGEPAERLSETDSGERRRRVPLDVGDRGLVVRRDLARRIVFVEVEPAPRAAIGQRAAFRTGDLEATDVRLVELVDLSGPPWPWIAAAAAGLFLALAILLGARRPPQRDEAAELALLHRHALALAVVGLGAAPLVAAALRGLVRIG